MKKGLSLLAVLAAILVCLGAFHQTANAQQVCTPPVTLHRFIVNNAELGTLLTTNFQEGVNLNFANYPFPNGYGKIALPPGPGYTPVPGQGLIPLYRYHISQNGRIYYGYFNGLASGNGYTFQGIAGYVLPGFGQFGGVPLQAYYSQTKGYFYTAGNEVPIGYPYQFGFAYHGSPAYLPQGASYCWNPPPPACSDPEGEQYCYNTGGNWNPGNCTCTYYPPDPCFRQQAGDEGGATLENKGTKGDNTGNSDRPIMPCYQYREAEQP